MTQPKTNRLGREKSPYLLQHSRNPVDWYAWGEEAFAKAAAEDKPILLSVGYSTCHWCHVMERESFEDPSIAAVMNEHFVSIKLDREERPEIDRVYMTAVQAMTGQGGWPLNVFLTPDLKPFFGGTYFPPRARWGRPGWTELLTRVAELWKTRRKDLEDDAGRLADALKGMLSQRGEPGTAEAEALDKAFAGLSGAFDPENAGFGGAPKFPMPVHQAFLLRYWKRTGKAEARDMAARSLRSMAGGGLFDQVGGGFHRYSTDAAWRVPHFEKMLYDNAQLASNLLEAAQVGGDPLLARAARDTLDYVLRDLRHPEGGFFSAEDADSLPEPGASEKSEGAFYLWTEAELEKLLGADAAAFGHFYGVKPEGNAPEDPHGEFEGKNILYQAHTIEDTAEKFSKTTADMERLLEKARRSLLAARASRPRPGLDDKILTSWNGLMISALALGHQVLGDERYLEAASSAARFLREKLVDPGNGRLYHRWREGERAVLGLADDYAFLVAGLVDLYEASLEANWLAWAGELAGQMLLLFEAPGGGLYLTAEGHDPRLLVRVMDDSDNVEPAASSAAALALLRLASLLGRTELGAAAERALSAFASRLAQRPLSLTGMLAALDFKLGPRRQLVIAGEKADARALLAEARRRFLPDCVVLLADEAGKAALGWALPALKDMGPRGGRPAAYLCRNFACRNPTSDPAELGRLLEEAAA